MCKCLSIIGRIIIGILSVLFAILGFVLLVLGIMVKAQSDALQQLFQNLLDSAKNQAQSAVGSNFNLSTENFDIAELVGGLAIAFIVIGVVMLLLGVFGVAGACCMVKCMIILYLTVVALFLVSQITMVIILAVDRKIVTEPPKAGLLTTLQQEYRGVNGSDTQSLLWNAIQNALQCCGIDNNMDFDGATLWQNEWGPSSNVVPPFQIPASCCKSGLFTTADRSCATDNPPSTLKTNKDTGCYDKVWDFILTGTPYIIFVSADIGGFALLTFFAAVILHQIIQKNKVASIV